MVAFFNSFISYLLLMFIIAAIAFCGGFIGVKLRKNKNAKEALEASNTSEGGQDVE